MPVREQTRYAVPRLAAAGAAVYALLAGCGLLLTRVFPDGPLLRLDRTVSQWFFEHRTATLNPITHFGSSMADTVTAIAVTVVLVVGLRLWLGRWRESMAVLVSILGELFIFVLVTATVHRQRPTVPHLDPAPPTSSFPSGHTGAAVALYAGLAVVLVSLSRRSGGSSTSRHAAGAGSPSGRRLSPGLTALVAALLCLVPVLVALSRIYRGMHFLTDVVAGALAGGLWTAMVMLTLLRTRPATGHGEPAGHGAHSRKPVTTP